MSLLPELTNSGHARLVEDVVAGRRAARQFDERIKASWRRCLGGYKLNPRRAYQPPIVSAPDLRQRRERVEPLLPIARVEMSALARLLNAPVGVMLTDHEGVILGYAGASEFSHIALRSGLREGAVWSEAEQGTNGMGTCLATRAAVLIQEDEHFLFNNAALTCCGAPIWDGTGQLVGALNISGCLRLSAAPTMALVRMAVQNIENRVLLTQHREHFILRFHPHRECISTAGEGIVAIDDGGRVVGSNHAALEWLGLPDHAAICQQPVETLLGLDMARLEAIGHVPTDAQPLPPRNRGSLCFGLVQPPASVHESTQGARSNALASAEREALRKVLEECRWNVSAAARRLGLSRRTLHRKLKSHALRRYTAWEAPAGGARPHA